MNGAAVNIELKVSPKGGFVSLAVFPGVEMAGSGERDSPLSDHSP